MNDRRHIALTVGSFVAVLLLGGGLLVWPAHREARSLDAQARDLYSRMANLEDTTAEVGRLINELAQARRYASENLKVITEGPEVADLMRRLSLRVDGATVLDQTFTTGSPIEAIPGEKGPQVMPITIDMQARFDSIFAVIRATEAMDRLVRISSIRLVCNRETKGGTSNRDESILTASVSIEAIYDPDITGSNASLERAVADAAREER